MQVHPGCVAELGRRGCPTLGCRRPWSQRVQVEEAVEEAGLASLLDRLLLLGLLGSLVTGVVTLGVAMVVNMIAGAGLDSPGAAGRAAAARYYATQPTVDTLSSVVMACAAVFCVVVIIGVVRSVAAEVQETL